MPMRGFARAVGRIGGWVLGRWPHRPANVYGARAFVAGVQLLHDLCLIREPLGLRER